MDWQPTKIFGFGSSKNNLGGETVYYSFGLLTKHEMTVFGFWTKKNKLGKKWT